MIDYSKLTGWTEFCESDTFKEFLAQTRAARELREAFPSSMEHQRRMKIMQDEDWEEKLNHYGYDC